MQTRLFIAGDKSHSGKSSICLSVIESIRQRQELKQTSASLLKPVSYIKPCTQCIDTQLVWKYCYKHELPFIGMGPVIYYNGFTSEVVNDLEHRGEEQAKRLTAISENVSNLKSEWVVIDGIGYSSVGSVVGCSNARVAKELRAPIVLIINVENGSLGNAIDTFNMNCLYMEHYHLQEQALQDHNHSRSNKVVGVIFNKIPMDVFEQRKNDIELYFNSHHNGRYKVYGCIPRIETLLEHKDVLCVKDTCTAIAMSRNDPFLEHQSNLQKMKQNKLQMTSDDEQKAQQMIDLFKQHVNIDQLLTDVEQHQIA